MKSLLSMLAMVLACVSCRSKPAAEGSPYPESWWEPVPPESAAWWEILPQAAGPGEVVLSKRNELGILSNFAPTPFEYRGRRYASVEGFWQMLKYPEGPDDPRARGVKWPHTRDEVARMTGFEAKQAGDFGAQVMKDKGIDWVTFEGRRLKYREKAKGEFYRLIVDVEWAKARQNEKVRDVLLRTGDLKLRPDHHEEPDAPPAWNYFDIWMEIRDELRKERGGEGRRSASES